MGGEKRVRKDTQVVRYLMLLGIVGGNGKEKKEDNEGW